MKKLLLLSITVLAGCDYFDSPYEKAQKTIESCQPYRRTIVELEDKISLLESKISYLRSEVDTLESDQY
jgi:outer membrane murein-binding lipoprotein Lpp